MTDVLLNVQGVSKSFLHEGKTIEVLKALDLVVHEKESVAIVGPSGAGKSTLLHLLGALDEPTSGQISFDGVDLSGLNATEKSVFVMSRWASCFSSIISYPNFLRWKT